MEVREEAIWLVHARRPKSRGQINSATTILQTSHYLVQNYKNATIGPQMWSIHLDDVEMAWK